MDQKPTPKKEAGAVYPNQKEGYHKILPDEGMHDKPTDASICFCSKAPLRSTLREITEEVVRARTKFPSARFTATALGEEVGELAEEIELLDRFTNLVKHYGEVMRQNLQRNPERVRFEAKQVAGLAIRIMEEGDPVYAAVTDENAQL